MRRRFCGRVGEHHAVGRPPRLRRVPRRAAAGLGEGRVLGDAHPLGVGDGGRRPEPPADALQDADRVAAARRSSRRASPRPRAGRSPPPGGPWRRSSGQQPARRSAAARSPGGPPPGPAAGSLAVPEISSAARGRRTGSRTGPARTSRAGAAARRRRSRPRARVLLLHLLDQRVVRLDVRQLHVHAWPPAPAAPRRRRRRPPGAGPASWLIGLPVRDDGAVEAPLAAQDVAEHPAVGVRGDAVDLVVRRHHGCGRAPA